MAVATLLTVFSFFWLIYNSIKGSPNDKALKFLIPGVIMFVIGFGGCIAFLNFAKI